jgi:hypothetical protein
MDSSTGYKDGWELKILGIRIAGKIDNHPFTEPQKLNLLNRNEIIKVSVKNKNEDEDVLFTTYNDAETIDSLYNIFKKLETTNAGLITYLEEYYEVTFYKNDNEEIKGEKSVIEVYEEDGKYYAREPVEYAIYELTENEYNTIKEYSN